MSHQEDQVHFSSEDFFLIPHKTSSKKPSKKLRCNYFKKYVTECFDLYINSLDSTSWLKKKQVSTMFYLVTVYKALQVWLGISNKLRDL